MELETIAFIITGVFAVLGTFFGVKYKNTKIALKETADVVVVIVKANEDNKISNEELSEIITEVKEAGGAWADVFKKA